MLRDEPVRSLGLDLLGDGVVLAIEPGQDLAGGWGVEAGVALPHGPDAPAQTVAAEVLQRPEVLLQPRRHLGPGHRLGGAQEGRAIGVGVALAIAFGQGQGRDAGEEGL